MFDAPDISVLLPVHNAGQFLRMALDSLAAQRASSFEVIAVDDGSTDGSRDILHTAARRYRWLRVLTQDRAGVASALNHAWSKSRAGLVARMDADDISEPERLAAQAEFLRQTPSVGVCGSWFRVIGSGRCGLVRLPITDTAIRARLVFASPFAHPAVMMRRAVLPTLGQLYDPRAVGMEDFDLWLRLAERTQLHNLPRALLRYRQHAAQVTQSTDSTRRNRLEALRREFLRRRSIVLNAEQARAHAASGFECSRNEDACTEEVQAWLQHLAAELPRTGWCDATELRRECAEAWWRFTSRNQQGVRAAIQFWMAPFTPFRARFAWRAMRLALRG